MTRDHMSFRSGTPRAGSSGAGGALGVRFADYTGAPGDVPTSPGLAGHTEVPDMANVLEHESERYRTSARGGAGSGSTGVNGHSDVVPALVTEAARGWGGPPTESDGATARRPGRGRGQAAAAG